MSPIQDAAAEGAETAIISIATGSGYSVGTPSSVTASILDDDQNTVSIAATTPTAIEGGANVVPLQRTGRVTSCSGGAQLLTEGAWWCRAFKILSS